MAILALKRPPVSYWYLTIIHKKNTIVLTIVLTLVRIKNEVFRLVISYGSS
ncbi:hypothetical protein PNI0076_00360 [Streptococcus pneumoniae PNI0076]|nr:hypothetical protein PNI0076_00360 [Streptococcus pneumoniae PNI0076]EMY83725.1 hypothetical protein PNI0159_01858 [Streptococcus pneumoniae PNI0159]EMY84787.1 hypothetical protein PNI0212_01549 [Streptococcus pneumoniae PNI0212]EMY88815.1 hypothetical protein PNI0164_00493 [Streptococcus pneumoniae PNI0164]